MRIGISVHSHAGQNIWENGLGQNVIFLAELLRRLPFVAAVSLVDVGDQQALAPQVDLQALDLRLIPVREAADQIDVVVEMAGVLDPHWLALQRARGKKVVHYCAGQPFARLVEPAVFERPGSFLQAGRCDAVWVLPAYAAFNAFQRVMYRCPVEVVPYLWRPQFVQQRIDEVSGLGFHYGWLGAAQGGPSRAAGLRVAIFEPNVSVAKTSSIAMLACDEACRADAASVQTMHVLNTLHLKDHATMLYLANSLDLVKQHKACFHGRHDVVGFMVQHADAVVSHQWSNDQNYSHLDVLYGDYPLVHNSPWLHGFGAGYYYPGFDAAEGGRQLLLAAREHDARLAEQRRAAQAVFAAVDPLAPANLQAYADRLRQLCSDRPDLLEA
jgi:hypothetical protein